MLENEVLDAREIFVHAFAIAMRAGVGDALSGKVTGFHQGQRDRQG